MQFTGYAVDFISMFSHNLHLIFLNEFNPVVHCIVFFGFLASRIINTK